MRLFKSILIEKFGIDGAIGFTLLARIIQASGGVISLVFIALFLNGDEQGYYYTFGSIVAIQIFFELGLSSIITQYVAHENAHLKWSENTIVQDSAQHLSRLSSLLRFCVKVFGLLSILLFIVLTLAGFLFFSKYHFECSSSSIWQGPWIVLVLSTSLMFFLNPILAFVEGLGKVKDIARLRFFQQIVNIAALGTILAIGGKLYALGVASLLSFLVLFLGIWFSYLKKLLLKIYESIGPWTISYWNEVFPYQWKIALSWMSGYFIFQLFNPVLFATEGAVIAGRMGMTLAALNGISGLSMSWITTKIPLFSSFIALRDYASLNRVFYKAIRQLSIVNFVLLLFFIICVFFLQFFGIEIGFRFLETKFLILLCMVVFANQFVFSWATYLRCHKKEPFMENSIVIGCLCALSTFLLGNHYGLAGIVIGYTGVSLIIGFPWAFFIFRKYRTKWHSQKINLNN